METKPKQPLKSSWKTGEGQGHFLRMILGAGGLGALLYYFVTQPSLDDLLAQAKTVQQFTMILENYSSGPNVDLLGMIGAILGFMGYDVKKFIDSRTALKDREMEVTRGYGS